MSSRGVPPPSDGRGVPPPSDGSYARLVGGVAVRLDRRSELTAVGEVYRRKRKYDGLYEPPSIFTLSSLRRGLRPPTTLSFSP